MTSAPIFLKLNYFRKNMWMLAPYQFHFQFILGYELKTAGCSSKIAKEPVVIQADWCWKNVNEIKGTSWT